MYIFIEVTTVIWFSIKSFITFNFVYNHELHLHVKEAFLTVYLRYNNDVIFLIN